MLNLSEPKKCEGCPHWSGRCDCYQYPEAQHSRIGGCAMRMKINSQGIEIQGIQKKLNPLKASKRGTANVTKR